MGSYVKRGETISSDMGAESTNGSKYKKDPCLLKPASNCLSILVPCGIEGSSIATNPNNKLVFGFRHGTLPHQPLDLAVGHTVTLNGDQLGLDRKCISSCVLYHHVKGVVRTKR